MEKVNLDRLEQVALANGQMTQADGAAFHRERLATHPEKFGEDVLQRLRIGAALSSTDYSLARRTQAESRRWFEQFFERVDLLISADHPHPRAAHRRHRSHRGRPQVDPFHRPIQPDRLAGDFRSLWVHPGRLTNGAAIGGQALG